jgi:hypothetical protein
MSWLRDENDDLYDPSYTDMLRVSFTSEFKRGRLQDLVALLSGRNFETRTYEEVIAESSFKMLEAGIMKYMNKTNFQRFVMIVRSAGFIDPSMIRSNVIRVLNLMEVHIPGQSGVACCSWNSGIPTTSWWKNFWVRRMPDGAELRPVRRRFSPFPPRYARTLACSLPKTLKASYTHRQGESPCRGYNMTLKTGRDLS